MILIIPNKTNRSSQFSFQDLFFFFKSAFKYFLGDWLENFVVPGAISKLNYPHYLKIQPKTSAIDLQISARHKIADPPKIEIAAIAGRCR